MMAPEDAGEAERERGRQGRESSRPPEMAQGETERERESGGDREINIEREGESKREIEREGASQKAREGEREMGGQGERSDRECERERCYGRSLYA